MTKKQKKMLARILAAAGGFVAVALVGLSNVGVAIVGGILAVLVFNNSETQSKEVSVDVNEI